MSVWNFRSLIIRHLSMQILNLTSIIVLYMGYPCKKGYLKPVGEWNYQEVIVQGTSVKVILNGTTIVDGDIAGPRDRGTPDQRDHPGLKNKTGHIGFLGHGSELNFVI